MTAYQKTATTLILAFVCALIVGCGGSDEEPPTKAAFIKQADAVCLGADEKQEKGIQAVNDKTPLRKLGEAEFKKVIVEVGFPPLEEMVEELNELTPPEGDEDQFEALVTEVEEALEKAKANPESLTAETTSPFRKADKQGEKYGFEECDEFS